jgi:hypothetical protein
MTKSWHGDAIARGLREANEAAARKAREPIDREIAEAVAAERARIVAKLRRMAKTHAYPAVTWALTDAANEIEREGGAS